MNPRWELEKLFSLQRDSCIYLQLHEILCVIATCTSISSVVINKDNFTVFLKVFIRLILVLTGHLCH